MCIMLCKVAGGYLAADAADAALEVRLNLSLRDRTQVSVRQLGRVDNCTLRRDYPI